jgi:uncharacterized protein
MQSKLRPLDRAELAELSEFLGHAPGGMSLTEAHGFLTAIVSGPTTILPSAWQKPLFGDAGFATMDEARHVFDLVMRFYNGIVDDLASGRPVAPATADDDAVALWCEGYLRATRMDEVWSHDERAAVSMFPIAILAGEVDLVGEKDSRGKIIEDPGPQLRRAREYLEESVQESYAYWLAWRRANDPTPARSPKVGRNEPCPCGSGLKFKKCCALKDA